MEGTRQPRRAYDSSGRRLRAARAREEVIDAARRLFVSDGYARTTVAAIAREAHVSAPTVYAAYGSKAALLRAVIEAALAGDTDPVPVTERPLARWVDEADTAQELVRRYAQMMGALAQRSAEVYSVLTGAADGDAELADLLEDFEQQRLNAAARITEAVRRRGGLPEGRSAAEARDLIWMLTDPLHYVSLTRKRRWSHARYVAWAEEALTKMVLEPRHET
jgi:AcrR family transcriptional regulator